MIFNHGCPPFLKTMIQNRKVSIITKIKRRGRSVEDERREGKSEKENEHEINNSEIFHSFLSIWPSNAIFLYYFLGIAGDKALPKVRGYITKWVNLLQGCNSFASSVCFCFLHYNKKPNSSLVFLILIT